MLTKVKYINVTNLITSVVRLFDSESIVIINPSHVLWSLIHENYVGYTNQLSGDIITDIPLSYTETLLLIPSSEHNALEVIQLLDLLWGEYITTIREHGDDVYDISSITVEDNLMSFRIVNRQKGWVDEY